MERGCTSGGSDFPRPCQLTFLPLSQLQPPLTAEQKCFVKKVLPTHPLPAPVSGFLALLRLRRERGKGRLLGI